MEGRSHDVVLAHCNRVIAFGGNDFHPRPELLDPRGADKHHLDGRAIQLPLADGTLKLTAVSVASNANVEHSQAFLLGIFDFVGEQDGTCTCAESWLHA